MDAIIFMLALICLAWLAPRYGVDSREGIKSDERILARRGFAGGWLSQE